MGSGGVCLIDGPHATETIGPNPATASLDVARAKPGSQLVSWVETEATHLPVTEDIDVAVMTGNVAQVFLDDDEWAAVLRRTAAVLRAGGHLVLETRDPARQDVTSIDADLESVCWVDEHGPLHGEEPAA